MATTINGVYECIRQTINNKQDSVGANGRVKVNISVGTVLLCVVVSIGLAGLWSVLIVLSNADVSKNSMVGVVVATFLIASVVILSLTQAIFWNRWTLIEDVKKHE